MNEKVIFADDVILTFGDAAFHVGFDAHFKLERCTVMGMPKFWKEPLLWLACRVLKRHHYKGQKQIEKALSEIDLKEEGEVKTKQ